MKKGDVVNLKSGSPNMTVAEVVIDPELITDPKALRLNPQAGQIICVWFKGSSKKMDCFSEELLEQIHEY